MPSVRYRDVAARHHGQAVKARAARQSRHQTAAVRVKRLRRTQHARPFDVKGPQPRPFGVGGVQRLAVRRQAAAIGAQNWKRQFDDLRAIRHGVIQAAVVAVTRVPLAQIGEIKTAVRVEHQVVRRRELMAVALGIQRCVRPGFRVDALNGAEFVVGVRPLPHRRPFDVAAAAVVA